MYSNVYILGINLISKGEIMSNTLIPQAVEIVKQAIDLDNLGN